MPSKIVTAAERHRAALLQVLARGLLALSITLAIGCASRTPVRADAEADCRPSFPYSGGWLGGDAAFSVDLDAVSASPGEMRTLWLFGDSFVGPPDATDRVGSHFIHNSIAISRCGPGGFEIDYAWRNDASGQPDAFFAPHTRGEVARPSAPTPNASAENAPYWWLFDGFVHAGALYVGLLEITPSAPQSALALPFRMTGMHLARIDDPARPPHLWNVDITRLSDTELGFPAATLLIHDEHVYLFSFAPLVDGHQQRFLARLPLTALARWDGHLTDALETWVDDGTWAAGFDPENARILMADNATEMSVEFVPELDRWLAVYGAPIQVDEAEGATLSSTVFARTATKLTGPWSERAPIYRIPEMLDPREAGTICYAAKSHARFARPTQLFLTYVCNLYAPPGADPYEALVRLQRNMALYRPVGVDLPLPAP